MIRTYAAATLGALLLPACGDREKAPEKVAIETPDTATNPLEPGEAYLSVPGGHTPALTRADTA